MACLSVAPEDGEKGFNVAAHPIYPLAAISELQGGATFVFEVLAADASFLMRRVGQTLLFYLDESLFWGEIVSADVASPEHPTVQALHPRPAVRVTMIIRHAGEGAIH